MDHIWVYICQIDLALILQTQNALTSPPKAVVHWEKLFPISGTSYKVQESMRPARVNSFSVRGKHKVENGKLGHNKKKAFYIHFFGNTTTFT